MLKELENVEAKEGLVGPAHFVQLTLAAFGASSNRQRRHDVLDLRRGRC